MSIKTGQQLIAEAKSRIKEVTARDTMARIAAGEPVILVDIREANEWNLGHLPNAIWVTRGNLETRIEAQVSRDASIVLYCASGNRSAFAAETLQEMGYTDVVSMAGGFKDWVAIGGDIAD